ncbi:hypothetical protein ACPB9E_36035 [Streptomyces exfoliatus]|uniref:hypothetical protein n=1 Tax=Streptomyces exfoliatus TaxID=1905 RepID=UPI003C30871C
MDATNRIRRSGLTHTAWSALDPSDERDRLAPRRRTREPAHGRLDRHRRRARRHLNRWTAVPGRVPGDQLIARLRAAGPGAIADLGFVGLGDSGPVADPAVITGYKAARNRPLTRGQKLSNTALAAVRAPVGEVSR